MVPSTVIASPYIIVYLLNGGFIIILMLQIFLFPSRASVRNGLQDLLAEATLSQSVVMQGQVHSRCNGSLVPYSLVCQGCFSLLVKEQFIRLRKLDVDMMFLLRCCPVSLRAVLLLLPTAEINMEQTPKCLNKLNFPRNISFPQTNMRGDVQPSLPTFPSSPSLETVPLLWIACLLHERISLSLENA